MPVFSEKDPREAALDARILQLVAELTELRKRERELSGAGTIEKE